MAQAHGSKSFQVFDINGFLVGEWINKTECARELGLTRSCIRKCLNNKAKKTKGYIFKYKEEI